MILNTFDPSKLTQQWTVEILWRLMSCRNGPLILSGPARTRSLSALSCRCMEGPSQHSRIRSVLGVSWKFAAGGLYNFRWEGGHARFLEKSFKMALPAISQTKKDKSGIHYSIMRKWFVNFKYLLYMFYIFIITYCEVYIVSIFINKPVCIFYPSFPWIPLSPCYEMLLCLQNVLEPGIQ